MYQAKSGVKNFSLSCAGGGGPLTKYFFCQSEHVSSQIWCQKFFPFLRGGWSLDKIFFLPVWTCIKPNLVSKIFPFTGGGGPRQKNFFPVWTCIKPNLVSKIFPFTETRYPPSPNLDLGPPQTWTWDPPRPGPGTPLLPKVNRQTFPSINITFPRTTYAGGKKKKKVIWRHKISMWLSPSANGPLAVSCVDSDLICRCCLYWRKISPSLWKG